MGSSCCTIASSSSSLQGVASTEDTRSSRHERRREEGATHGNAMVGRGEAASDASVSNGQRDGGLRPSAAPTPQSHPRHHRRRRRGGGPAEDDPAEGFSSPESDGGDHDETNSGRTEEDSTDHDGQALPSLTASPPREKTAALRSSAARQRVGVPPDSNNSNDARGNAADTDVNAGNLRPSQVGGEGPRGADHIMSPSSPSAAAPPYRPIITRALAARPLSGGIAALRGRIDAIKRGGGSVIITDVNNIANDVGAQNDQGGKNMAMCDPMSAMMRQGPSDGGEDGGSGGQQQQQQRNETAEEDSFKKNNKSKKDKKGAELSGGRNADESSSGPQKPNPKFMPDDADLSQQQAGSGGGERGRGVIEMLTPTPPRTSSVGSAAHNNSSNVSVLGAPLRVMISAEDNAQGEQGGGGRGGSGSHASPQPAQSPLVTFSGLHKPSDASEDTTVAKLNAENGHMSAWGEKSASLGDGPGQKRDLDLKIDAMLKNKNNSNSKNNMAPSSASSAGKGKGSNAKNGEEMVNAYHHSNPFSTNGRTPPREPTTAVNRNNPLAFPQPRPPPISVSAEDGEEELNTTADRAQQGGKGGLTPPHSFRDTMMMSANNGGGPTALSMLPPLAPPAVGARPSSASFASASPTRTYLPNSAVPNVAFSGGDSASIPEGDLGSGKGFAAAKALASDDDQYADGGPPSVCAAAGGDAFTNKNRRNMRSTSSPPPLSAGGGSYWGRLRGGGGGVPNDLMVCDEALQHAADGDIVGLMEMASVRGRDALLGLRRHNASISSVLPPSGAEGGGGEGGEEREKKRASTTRRDDVFVSALVLQWTDTVPAAFLPTKDPSHDDSDDAAKKINRRCGADDLAASTDDGTASPPPPPIDGAAPSRLTQGALKLLAKENTTSGGDDDVDGEGGADGDDVESIETGATEEGDDAEGTGRGSSHTRPITSFIRKPSATAFFTPATALPNTINTNTTNAAGLGDVSRPPPPSDLGGAHQHHLVANTQAAGNTRSSSNNTHVGGGGGFNAVGAAALASLASSRPNSASMGGRNHVDTNNPNNNPTNSNANIGMPGNSARGSRSDVFLCLRSYEKSVAAGPFHMAARKGHIDVIEYLEKYANTTNTNSSGEHGGEDGGRNGGPRPPTAASPPPSSGGGDAHHRDGSPPPPPHPPSSGLMRGGINEVLFGRAPLHEAIMGGHHKLVYAMLNKDGSAITFPSAVMVRQSKLPDGEKAWAAYRIADGSGGGGGGGGGGVLPAATAVPVTAYDPHRVLPTHATVAKDDASPPPPRPSLSKEEEAGGNNGATTTTTANTKAFPLCHIQFVIICDACRTKDGGRFGLTTQRATEHIRRRPTTNRQEEEEGNNVSMTSAANTNINDQRPSPPPPLHPMSMVSSTSRPNSRLGAASGGTPLLGGLPPLSPQTSLPLPSHHTSGNNNNPMYYNSGARTAAFSKGEEEDGHGEGAPPTCEIIRSGDGESSLACKQIVSVDDEPPNNPYLAFEGGGGNRTTVVYDNDMNVDSTNSAMVLKRRRQTLQMNAWGMDASSPLPPAVVGGEEKTAPCRQSDSSSPSSSETSSFVRLFDASEEGNVVDVDGDDPLVPAFCPMCCVEEQPLHTAVSVGDFGMVLILLETVVTAVCSILGTKPTPLALGAQGFVAKLSTGNAAALSRLVEDKGASVDSPLNRWRAFVTNRRRYSANIVGGGGARPPSASANRGTSSPYSTAISTSSGQQRPFSAGNSANTTNAGPDRASAAGNPPFMDVTKDLGLDTAALAMLSSFVNMRRFGDGYTALHVAAGKGYTDIVDVLLSHNADALARAVPCVSCVYMGVVPDPPPPPPPPLSSLNPFRFEVPLRLLWSPTSVSLGIMMPSSGTGSNTASRPSSATHNNNNTNSTGVSFSSSSPAPPLPLTSSLSSCVPPPSASSSIVPSYCGVGVRPVDAARFYGKSDVAAHMTMLVAKGQRGTAGGTAGRVLAGLVDPQIRRRPPSATGLILDACSGGGGGGDSAAASSTAYSTIRNGANTSNAVAAFAIGEKSRRKLAMLSRITAAGAGLFDLPPTTQTQTQQRGSNSRSSSTPSSNKMKKGGGGVDEAFDDESSQAIDVKLISRQLGAVYQPFREKKKTVGSASVARANSSSFQSSSHQNKNSQSQSQTALHLPPPTSLAELLERNRRRMQYAAAAASGGVPPTKTHATATHNTTPSSLPADGKGVPRKATLGISPLEPSALLSPVGSPTAFPISAASATQLPPSAAGSGGVLSLAPLRGSGLRGGGGMYSTPLNI